MFFLLPIDIKIEIFKYLFNDIKILKLTCRDFRSVLESEKWINHYLSHIPIEKRKDEHFKRKYLYFTDNKYIKRDLPWWNPMSYFNYKVVGIFRDNPLVIRMEWGQYNGLYWINEENEMIPLGLRVLDNSRFQYSDKDFIRYDDEVFLYLDGRFLGPYDYAFIPRQPDFSQFVNTSTGAFCDLETLTYVIGYDSMVCYDFVGRYKCNVKKGGNILCYGDNFQFIYFKKHAGKIR